MSVFLAYLFLPEVSMTSNGEHSCALVYADFLFSIVYPQG